MGLGYSHANAHDIETAAAVDWEAGYLCSDFTCLPIFCTATTKSRW